MINWYGYSQHIRNLTYEEAHPEPELRLTALDQKRRNYQANELLLDLVRQPHRKRVLLTGRPGSGKSYLLSKLHYELAVDFEHEIELATSNEREQYARLHKADLEHETEPTDVSSGVKDYEFQPVTSTVIPILVRLNAFEAGQESTREPRTIANIIEQQMSGVGYAGSVFELFRSPARFVVLIDDLDETLTSGTSENLREVRRFVDNVLVYPNVQVIMAGRPIAAMRFANEFRTYTVQSLDDVELSLLFKQTVDDPERLMAYLTKWDGLKDFVATPYFANEAAGYWRDKSDEEFSLGRMLYALIDNGLIERQTKTENRDRIRAILRERVNLVERLAFQSISHGGWITNDMMRAIAVEHDNIDVEEWLFLMEFAFRDGSKLGWRNKWIHAYFAAHYLSRHDVAASRTERVTMLRSLMPNNHDRATVPANLPITTILLQDLTGDDYSVDVPEIVGYLELDLSPREIRSLTRAFEENVAEYIRTAYEFSNVETPFRPRYIGKGEIDVRATKLDGNKYVVWIVECKLRFPEYPKPIEPEYISQLQKYAIEVRELERQYAEDNNRVLAFSAILATNGQDRGLRTLSLARESQIHIWDFKIPALLFTARVDLAKCDIQRFH